MTEEERKAIEFLQKEYKKLIEEGNILFPLYKNQANTILNLIAKLQKENEYMHKELDKQQTTINNYAKENKEKDNKVRKIINRLDNDIFKISKSKEINRWDDYRRCRLKAYRTKTREIKEYIEEQYFENKAKE